VTTVRVTDADFTAYTVGAVSASACTCLDDEAATRQMNIDHPTGISSQWEIADEPFKDGTPNRSPCHDDPARRHLLFHC
jgi:hypothetical protein